MNQIKKIHIPGDSDRFDKTLTNHVHFYCIRCNEVSDAINRDIATLYQLMEKQINASIISIDTVITGICNSCNRKEEK